MVPLLRWALLAALASPVWGEIHSEVGINVAMSLLSDNLRHNYPRDGVNVAPENTTVRITLHVYSVFGLDENEVMELNGWVECQWRDPRLSWDPERWSNIKTLLMTVKTIWTPDVGFANSKQKQNKDFSNVDELRVEINSTGHVSMHSYIISETPCPIETFLFPFDRQSCPLEIGAYYSKTFGIDVEKVYFKSLRKNTVGEWIPEGYRLSESNHYHRGVGSSAFSNCVIYIVLRRKPLYHIVLVLIPYSLTSVVANLLFILKPPTERLRVSLSVLLSMTVYVMIVARQAPKSMRGPSLLGVFLLGQMLFLVLLTFAAVAGPLLFPRRAPREAEAADAEAEEEKEARREQHYRVLGRRWAGWGPRYDHACLALHVASSCLNGFVCLFVIPSVAGSVPAGTRVDD